mgnify:CR=1 FL=1
MPLFLPSCFLKHLDLIKLKLGAEIHFQVGLLLCVCFKYGFWLLCAQVDQVKICRQSLLFSIFITLNGCSRQAGDVYKTCYCFKSPAACCACTVLCGNWWLSKVQELVAWRPMVMSRVSGFASPPPCCRDSTAVLGRVKSRYFTYVTGNFYNTFTQSLIGLEKRQRAILLVSSQLSLIM